MRISPGNVLSRLGDADVVVMPTAIGYEQRSLVRGSLDEQWRGSVPVSGLTITLHTRGAPMQAFGIFGLVLDPGVRIDGIRVWRSTTWPVSGVDNVGEIHLDERGDGWLVAESEKEHEAIQFDILLTAASAVRIGKLWAGQWEELPPPRTISRRVAGNTLRNVSDARSYATATLASRTQTLELDWPPMREEREQIIAEAVEAAGYGAHPVVVAPDPRKPEWFVYGYLSDDLRADWDASQLRTGIRLTLEEEGRAIGG